MRKKISKSSKPTNAIFAMILVTVLAGSIYSYSVTKPADAQSVENNNDTGRTTSADEENLELRPVLRRSEWPYPTNESGQTYGSIGDYHATGELPDLICAEATNGQSGYILATDYIRTSSPAGSREEGQAMMEEREQKAVDAFYEFILDKTGVQIDREAFRELYREVNLSNGANCTWRRLSEQQQSRIMRLLPESYQSYELAQQAFEAAQTAHYISIPVYAVDGKTIIGELIVQ